MGNSKPATGPCALFTTVAPTVELSRDGPGKVRLAIFTSAHAASKTNNLPQHTNAQTQAQIRRPVGVCDLTRGVCGLFPGGRVFLIGSFLIGSFLSESVRIIEPHTAGQVAAEGALKHLRGCDDLLVQSGGSSRKATYLAQQSVATAP